MEDNARSSIWLKCEANFSEKYKKSTQCLHNPLSQSSCALRICIGPTDRVHTNSHSFHTQNIQTERHDQYEQAFIKAEIHCIHTDMHIHIHIIIRKAL